MGLHASRRYRERGIAGLSAGLIAGLSAGLLLAGSAAAQSEGSLAVYFDIGSAALQSEQAQVLDKAARLYREGSPIVMILSGGTDTLGPAGVNLSLSIDRARTVLDGLVARGIPVERLQIAGRGETDLEVETGDGVAEARNRNVEITWR